MADTTDLKSVAFTGMRVRLPPPALLNMKTKQLTEKQKIKRKKAADSLRGIWANLPKKVLKELLKKTY